MSTAAIQLFKVRCQRIHCSSSRKEGQQVVTVPSNNVTKRSTAVISVVQCGTNQSAQRAGSVGWYKVFLRRSIQVIQVRGFPSPFSTKCLVQQHSVQSAWYTDSRTRDN
eukprot:548833-Rhodomonas_salina.1